MDASLYPGSERRQTPRTTVEAVTYIHLEPNNGGILLNISEGGICFHAVGPVQRTEALRIWFSVEGHRIDPDVELAWTDGTQKTGGLRFTSLSPQMHEQIRSWIRNPSTLSTVQKKAATSVPKTQALGALSASRSHRSSPPSGPPPLQEVPPERKAGLLLPGFSRGLFTGLLISALVAVALLLHTYRRQFGETLIQLGEGFGAKPPAQMVTRPPMPIPFPLPERPPVPLTEAVKPHVAKRGPAAPVTAAPSSPIAPSPKSALGLDSNPVSDDLGKIPQPESANGPSGDALLPQPEPTSYPSADAGDGGELNAGSPSGRYFDVGKFRNKQSADTATEKLAQLGFQARVIRKGLFWMSSYHVLVGPYGDDDEAEAARNNLESRGFRPQSLSRKSRNFRLPPMTLYGTDITLHECIISWDSNSSAATVKFINGRNVVAIAQGRWVKRDVKYKLDAVVDQSNVRGPRTLLEIQCRGMNRVLVFDESKPVRFFTPPSFGANA